MSPSFSGATWTTDPIGCGVEAHVAAHVELQVLVLGDPAEAEAPVDGRLGGGERGHREALRPWPGSGRWS